MLADLDGFWLDAMSGVLIARAGGDEDESMDWDAMNPDDEGD